MIRRLIRRIVRRVLIEHEVWRLASTHAKHLGKVNEHQVETYRQLAEEMYP